MNAMTALHPGAERLVALAAARAIKPRPPVRFRDWLGANIVLIDGERKGEPWSLEGQPALAEIADCLSEEHGCNLVTVRKAQQTGVSILAMAWMLYLADQCPDNALYALPSDGFVKDMNSRKFDPLIRAWHERIARQVIEPQISRSGAGSTLYEKKFPGGYIGLANVNVATELSGHTVRYGVKDEVSKWQNHANGDDPEDLFFGRFTAFRRHGTWKILELSTPEIDTGDELGDEPGHCRVDRSFKRSDQRFWHIRCPDPDCGVEFKQIRKWFQLDREHPHKSCHACPECGYLISEAERVAAIRAGRYVATAPGPGRHPGFHLDALDSLMMSYETIAEDIIAYSRPGGFGEKGIMNLVFGLPATEAGNAPDHEKLMARRENYREGVVPAAGLIVVAGADVQHDGIWVEIVAFGEDRQSWSLKACFLPGATDDPRRGSWPLLDDLWKTALVDVFGNEREIKALAVDAGDGGRTNQVLEWCRRRPDTYAVKGMKGHDVPAIGQQPQKKSVTRRGKRKRFGSTQLWPVGTWSLKSEFVSNMHKPGLAEKAKADPPGYCHFGDFLGKEYFLQITAESFVREYVRGRYREEWKRIRRDNHLFDARIYAMAMAEHMGLSTNRSDDWAALRARYIPDSHEGDLFGPSSRAPEAARRQSTARANDGLSLGEIARKMNGRTGS